MEKMMNTKSGKFLSMNAGTTIRNIILVVVLVLTIAALVPSVINALRTLALASGLQFAEFYAAGGAVDIAFGAAILLVVVAIFIGGKVSKR